MLFYPKFNADFKSPFEITNEKVLFEITNFFSALQTKILESNKI